jgi:hypothetical protein
MWEPGTGKLAVPFEGFLALPWYNRSQAGTGLPAASM